jgi:hypothetical protein
MPDEIADNARLMNVAEAINAEFQRQGVSKMINDSGFSVFEMAEAVIRAADGVVIEFRRPPRE